MFDFTSTGDFTITWAVLAYLGFVVGLGVVMLRTVYEIVVRPFRAGKDKTIWLMIVVMLFPVGLFIYYAKRKGLLAGPQMQ